MRLEKEIVERMSASREGVRVERREQRRCASREGESREGVRVEKECE